MTKGPNPTIAVHLTQKELDIIHRQLTGFPYSYGKLSEKISKAMVDIRPIIRDARREAKQTAAQAERQAKRDRLVALFAENPEQAEPEPYDGIMWGDDK